MSFTNINLNVKLEDLITANSYFTGLKNDLKNQFTDIWMSLIPKEGNQGPTIAYDPTSVNVKKCGQNNSEMPYYLVISNPARESRPKGAASSEYKMGRTSPQSLLDKNVIRRGLIMFDDLFEKYDVTPNGYPISLFHSLIISKDPKKQDDLTEEDIATGMAHSFLFDQFVIYNHSKAGGTIEDHFHLQGFPYEIIPNDKKTIPPLIKLINESRKYNKNEFSLMRYPAENKCFRGVNAPKKAMEYISANLIDKPCNIIMDKDTAVVIPRNYSEKLIETATQFAGLEMSGGIVTTEQLSKAMTYAMCDLLLRKCTIQYK